ncbi:thiamine pyrophosphate-binding protein [Phenylobacterium sp.]|uniref:thiamine pyrophosphate-binding protein n=1 Tax=Phenylobacterium sp. TaxID=1871053 RepID=UPI002F4272F4
MTKKRAGGELMAETLAGLGVTEIFALHGSHLDPLFIACADYGIRLTDTRHEAAAGHAADGYARSSNGKLGVCATTAGPGFTNTLTAITNAYLDKIPVLFISGAAPMRDDEANTLQGGFDALAMARPVTKWAYRVTDVDRIAEFTRRAAEIALSGPPGPVFLEIPIDVIFMPTDQAVSPPPKKVAPPAPSQETVDELIAVLRRSERPVIIAGGGAVLTDAGARLKAFAELTGIPVVASQKALGVLPDDHAFYGGAAGVLAAAAHAGSGPDAVLLLGARMGMFLGGAMGAIIPADAFVAQVEVDPQEIGRVRLSDLPIVADCGAMLDALLACAPNHSWTKRGDWAAQLRTLREAPHAAFAQVPPQSRPGVIHPYHAVKAVLEALPPEVTLVADGGEAGNWVGDQARSMGAGQFLRCGYLGCLGVSSGFAMGAARAHPGRPVVCFAGDGGAGFNIQEFDTMARHKLPVLTIVLNNSEWGMSRNAQALLYGKNHEAIVTLADVAYDTVAQGFNVRGKRIDTYEDLGPAVTEALNSGLPTCLNVIVDAGVPHPRTRMMVGDVSGGDGIPIPYYANIPIEKAKA